jgi:NAD(P)-dependent dehydrogenase (short-subunit alcohol dehydrogenase family)
MTDPLVGTVIVVTGGSSGIGQAVAVRLAAEGAAVIIAARRAAAGERVAAGIRTDGGQARFVATDVTVEADAASLVQAAVAEFGRLDGAVNNAGGVPAGGLIPHITDASWRAAIDQNLTSVFYALKYQIPAALDAGGGAIVNNASIGGVLGISGMAGYVAAKHGVIGLTRAAGLEYAKRGVRVNAIVTGNVDTPLYRSLLGVSPDAVAFRSAVAAFRRALATRFEVIVEPPDDPTHPEYGNPLTLHVAALVRLYAAMERTTVPAREGLSLFLQRHEVPAAARAPVLGTDVPQLCQGWPARPGHGRHRDKCRAAGLWGAGSAASGESWTGDSASV